MEDGDGMESRVRMEMNASGGLAAAGDPEAAFQGSGAHGGEILQEETDILNHLVNDIIIIIKE